MTATPSDYPPRVLADCDVCTGSGVMTARSMTTPPHAPPSLIACPACAGRGARLVDPPAPTLRVVPDA